MINAVKKTVNESLSKKSEDSLKTGGKEVTTVDQTEVADTVKDVNDRDNGNDDDDEKAPVQYDDDDDTDAEKKDADKPLSKRDDLGGRGDGEVGGSSGGMVQQFTFLPNIALADFFL